MENQVKTIEEVIAKANSIGWYLAVLCQYGKPNAMMFRVVFQRRKNNGSTESVFVEYEDAPDALTAMLNALKRCGRTNVTIERSLPPKEEAYLVKALDANVIARKGRRAPRRVLRKGST